MASDDSQSKGRRVSFDEGDATVNDGSPAAAGEGGDSSGDDDGNASDGLPPLHKSSRIKGYFTLFVFALYNYIAASAKAAAVEESENLSQDLMSNNTTEYEYDAKAAIVESDMWCLYMDDLGSLIELPLVSPRRLGYSMACSMITLIVVGWILLFHLDCCTPLRKSVWPKIFGPGKIPELCILIFLILLWVISTWLTTSIRGPGSEGKDQANLYFSTWICLFAAFFTLERWNTASGRASFTQFVLSWPNRCPLWIVTFLLSSATFFFALNTYRNWEEGTRFNPYAFNLYDNAPEAEWTFLLFVTSVTALVALAWALAEIFRLTRDETMKSDKEKYVEGLFAYILFIMWVVLVCIVTIPGGICSLLGNLYFSTWSTLFSVVGTLVWYIRDWRQDIADIIREEEEKYELAKRTIRRREEKRLAKLAEKEEGDRNFSVGTGRSRNNSVDESGVEEGVQFCEDDSVDDDITISITSDFKRSRLGTEGSSISSSPDRPRKVADAKPDESTTTADYRSLFMSALASFFLPLDDADDGHGDGKN